MNDAQTGEPENQSSPLEKPVTDTRVITRKTHLRSIPRVQEHEGSVTVIDHVPEIARTTPLTRVNCRALTGKREPHRDRHDVFTAGTPDTGRTALLHDRVTLMTGGAP